MLIKFLGVNDLFKGSMKCRSARKLTLLNLHAKDEMQCFVVVIGSYGYLSELLLSTFADVSGFRPLSQIVKFNSLYQKI